MTRLNQSIDAPLQAAQGHWRLWDYAAIGFFGGLLPITLEAIDRIIVLAPFFGTPGERALFLAYSSPTLIAMTVIGVLMGMGLIASRALGRLEDRFLATNPPARWKGWFLATFKLLLLGAVALAGALVLRRFFLAVTRRLYALARRFMQWLSPDLVELTNPIFQWIRAHPLIVFGLLLLVLLLVARWISRWPAITRIRLSNKRGPLLVLVLVLLLCGIYGLDSRYYFSIYDRSLHLPLSCIQLAIGLASGALIYRTISQRAWVKPVIGVGVLAALTLTLITFLKMESDQSLKALFWSRSVVARRTLEFLQWSMDFDRDGFAAILGGGDCNDSNRQIHPLARELPDNGIDENCLGGDLNLKKAEGGKQKAAEKMSPEVTDYGPRTTDHGPRVILLITLDAVRADHLGCYGYARASSPRLDQFARHATVFLNASSQGTNTVHSFTSMLRSAYGEAIFDESRPTVIETLAQHGYTTAFFLNQRTDRWLTRLARFKASMLKGIQWQGHQEEQAWSADVLTDEVIKYLASTSSSRRRFIWAHYLEPHAPYRHHPQFDFGERDIDLYDSEIAYVDQALGRLFDHLEQSDDWENMLVIVSADHGEAFFEHGQQLHNSRPYQEQIHVPLIVRHPSHAPGRLAQSVGLIDVGPTVLRFADIAPPTEYDGIDLFSSPGQIARPVLSETPRQSPEPAFYVWAMMDGPWKLMYNVVGHTFELYNLLDDPGEQKNLVDTNPAKVQEMAAKFGRWFDLQSIRSEHWRVRRVLRQRVSR
jgi:arylsulfatase A-like enzyme